MRQNKINAILKLFKENNFQIDSTESGRILKAGVHTSRSIGRKLLIRRTIFSVPKIIKPQNNVKIVVSITSAKDKMYVQHIDTYEGSEDVNCVFYI